MLSVNFARHLPCLRLDFAIELTMIASLGLDIQPVCSLSATKGTRIENHPYLID
jgi:hypothetical protein